MIDVDIALTQGTFTLSAGFVLDSRAAALFGPSGSGKTTILDAIAGLRTPDSGTIEVGGRVLFSSGRRIDLPVYQRHVGYVRQDVALFPHMHVRRNLLYGTHAASAPPDLSRVVMMLEIERLIDRRVTELSGGERQRVALARALIRGPRLLLCDEPTGNLDHAAAANVASVLLDMHRTTETMLVVVTHSVELARKCPARFELHDTKLIRAR
jgi:molybdate transport system ATP-binding protein